MTTLEEIYQKYFNCPVPFRNSGRLTTSGKVAHEKLISLLHDLVALGVIDDIARFCEIRLDELAEYGITTIQEMANDLKRFVTSGSEEYVLETPVHIKLDGIEYDVKYFTQDINYNDIFMTEQKWKEESDQDILDFTLLSEEDATKVFQSILCQEIENGWEWMEHARTVLKKKFPDTEYDEMIDAFICENWQNMKTDAWNVENFLNAL